MATKADSGITSSDAQYGRKYSAKIRNEGIVKCQAAQVLMEYGCINKEDDLSKGDAGTVTLYNRPRVSSNGVGGDADFYGEAERQKSNSREHSISKVSYPFKFKARGSQDEQFTPYKLQDGVEEAAGDWMRGLFTSSLLNQVCGNSATSINQPSVGDDPFSGDKLKHITGQNAVADPTYWYEANGGGAITSAAGVDNTNLLSLKDFEIAMETIGNTVAGRPVWQTFSGKDCLALALISRTGLNQLIREQTVAGQGPQLNEQIYNQLAGGEKIAGLDTFKVPHIPFKFVVFEDIWMPRGVASGAEQANTRRSVIVGRNALDLSFGQGFSVPSNMTGSGTTAGRSTGGRTVRGVNIELDPNYKRLNKEVYGNISLLYGASRTQVTGTGAQINNKFDLATYVIDHYSQS